MILERAAAYVLALACIFQTLHPSWFIKLDCWQTIDVRIGRFRVDLRNDDSSVCFEKRSAEQKACTTTTRMPPVHGWPKSPKRLTICMSDNGCMTAWMDGTLYAWSISKSRKSLFEESLIRDDSGEKAVSGD
jgi:hypothetical protein